MASSGISWAVDIGRAMERADVEAARAGDARAFESLMAREVGGVYRLALGRSPRTAWS